MTTVSAHVAHALEPHITDVFGVMGNGNAWFIDALRDTGVTYTAVRHEAATVAAADAYFRSSGRIAVATTTYGAGFTNAVTSLAEAAQARVPLLFVVGDQPSGGPRPWDVDQSAIAAATGVETFTVGLVDAAATAIRALQHARDTWRPVVLAIPYDLASDEVDEAAAPDLAPRAPMSAPAVERIVGQLSRAQRPLILAGRGAWISGAGDDLRALAERLDALVATTALGAGMFADDSGERGERDLGIAGGFSSPSSRERIAEADVVLVVGAALNQFTTAFGDLFGQAATVIQVDNEPAATIPRVDLYVPGDAAATTRALLEQSPQASHPDWVVGHRDGPPAGDPGASDGLLDPRTLARRLDELLPADRLVVQDGGHFLSWAPTYWRIPAPDRLLMVGTAYQSIGLGMPSAVGAAVARPECTIVVSSGDGGALMSLADLSTFIRVARSAVIVIWNDSAYGAELHQYAIRGLDPAPMLIEDTDFAAVARAFGASGTTVRRLSDLDALSEWVEAGAQGVHLLDCRISATVVAPYILEMVQHAIRG